MPGKTIVFLLLGALFLTMCRNYANESFTPEPTLTPTDVEFLTSTPESTRTPTRSPTWTASLTPVITAEPLLAETVSMCDLGGKLINFRLLAPIPELKLENLAVQIADHASTCYVNPTNPALLTCTISNVISFPAHVVVRVGNAVVNDFEYSGMGCAILTTPTPSKIRSYP